MTKYIKRWSDVGCKFSMFTSFMCDLWVIAASAVGNGGSDFSLDEQCALSWCHQSLMRSTSPCAEWEYILQFTQPIRPWENVSLMVGCHCSHTHIRHLTGPYLVWVWGGEWKMCFSCRFGLKSIIKVGALTKNVLRAVHLMKLTLDTPFPIQQSIFTPYKYKCRSCLSIDAANLQVEMHMHL
jgi:hypothetical protein